MATRLYLRDAATTVSGTLPSARLSTGNLQGTLTGASTNRSLSLVKGAAQIEVQDTRNASGGAFVWARRFVSEPVTAGLISGTVKLSGAVKKTAGTTVGQAVHVAVWRPSTGAVVGTLWSGWNSGTLEFSTGTSGAQVALAGPAQTVSGVTAQNGDVIVVELCLYEFGTGTNTYSLFHEGTTDDSASSTAAYIEFSQNLTFPATHALAGTASGSSSTSATELLVDGPSRISVLVDWDNDGDFDDPGEDVTGFVRGVEWSRGRSADFSSDAQGAASFTLNNVSGDYTPGVNPDLVPGRPVLIKSEGSGIVKAQFFGYIQRVSPNAKEYTVTVTCYDPLRRYAETEINVPAHAFVQRSARDLRREVLEEFERRDYNYLENPSFETNLTGWSFEGTSFTRVASDGFDGTACAELVGASEFSKAIARISRVPVTFSGVPYRFSVYLRVPSGTATWLLCLGNAYAGGSLVQKAVVVTTAWQRFSVTYTPTSSNGSASTTALRAWVESTAAGTVRIDGAMVTRGPMLPAFTASTAVVGRLPNYCGNGSFDGGAVNGWIYGYRNLVGNDGFETDTSGWSTAADAFIAVGATLTRQTIDPAAGVGHGQLDTTTNPAQEGAYFDLSGYTFKAGTAYDIRFTVKRTAGSRTIHAGIGSNSVPSDVATSGTDVFPSSWTEYAFTWTPTGNRSDAHVFFRTSAVSSASTFLIDKVMVSERDASETTEVPFFYADGPGGGLIAPTSRSVSAIAKYGSSSLAFVAPATAKVGMVYDFNHWKPYWLAGQPYTAQAEVRVSGAGGTIRLGLGAIKADGTTDEASATVAVSSSGWARVTVTWTPVADYSANELRRVYLFVCQDDATARTVYVDAVRVVAQGTADAYELDHWLLGQENDRLITAAAFSGSALSALNDLNRITLARHFIRPRLTAPFYEYVTSSREELASKVVSEVMSNSFDGFTQGDLDRDSIINIAPVQVSGGLEYYTRPVSIAEYGPQPASVALGSQWLPSDFVAAESIANAILDRYETPRMRPRISRKGKSYSYLRSIRRRELDDLIQVSLGRLGITDRKYLIVQLTTRVATGNIWEASWGLEEYPF